MKINYRGCFIFIGILLISMQLTFAIEEINIIKSYDKAGYHIFENNGKYGISSDSNDIVIPATLRLETLDRKLFIVQNEEGLFGVVDNNDNIVIPIKYAKINSEDGSDLIVGSREDHSQVIYWYEKDKLQSLDLVNKKLAIRGQSGYHNNYFVVVDKDLSNTKIDRLTCDIPYYVINDKGEIIIDEPIKYLLNKQGAYGVVLTMDDKYGLIDGDGNWLLKPIYDYISPYDVELKKKSFIIAKKDGFYHGYDLNGKVVLGENYTHMAFVDPKFILASKDNNKTQSILDLKGNIILTVRNKDIKKAIEINGQTYYLCNNGLESKSNNLGLLKSNGTWLIKPEFNVISYIEEYNYFDCGKHYHDRYYYNINGNLINYLNRSKSEGISNYLVYKQDDYKTNIRIENYYGDMILNGYQISDKFINDDYYVAYDNDKTYKILDKKGKVVFTTNQMEFRRRFGNLYLFKNYSDEKYQFIDSKFNNVGKSFLDIFYTEDKALWGYDGKNLLNYDLKGNYRFSIKHDPIEFYNGQLISKPANKKGVGVESSWDKCGSDPNKLYGLIDTNTGEIILDINNKSILKRKDNYYLVEDEKDNKGIVNSQGKRIVKTKYNEIYDIYNYDLDKTLYFKTLTKDNLYGLIDYLGNEILPGKYKQIGKEIRIYDSILDQYKYNLRSTGSDYKKKVRD